MKAWLIYSDNDVEKNKGYIEIYFKECVARNIQLELLLAEEITIGIIDNRLTFLYKNRSIDLPDFVICRTIYPLLTYHMEQMGLKVYNNSKVADICNDKQMTLLFVNELGIPIANTCFGKKGSKLLINSYPKVIKPSNGHGGAGVVMLNNFDDLLNYEKGINTDYLIQDVACEGKDLRVYVVGKQIVASMLRESSTDFRANFSLGGKAKVYNLNDSETKLVRRIVDAFDFGLVGIDFMFDQNSNLLLNEIEDVVGARMLYAHTNINIVSLYLDHILKDISRN